MPPALAMGAMAAATIGSAAIASSSASSTGQAAAKNAKKSTGNAVSTLQQGQAQYLNSPLYQQGFQLAQQLMGSGGSMSPDVVEKIKQNSAAQAHQGANNAFGEMMNRVSTTSGTRSGATVGGSAEISSRLGESLATGNRQADIMAATQNRQDQVQMLNLMNQMLAQQFSWPQAIANAQLGQGQTMASLANIPSPLQQAGQGVGQLGGNIFSAAGAAGGFGNLFGNGPPNQLTPTANNTIGGLPSQWYGSPT